MQISFENKTILITGATSELGRVMARSFAASGGNVAIHYLQNKSMAEQLQKEATALGVRAVTVQADITRQEDVQRIRDEIGEKLGAPHIVVDNAVGKYQWTEILDQPNEDFLNQFETCVMHNVLMAKAFMPAMIERQWGRFIGINTECAMLCAAGSGAYASAKRGMDGIYRTLAKEVGRHNITVNQIAPGWTISDQDRAAGTEHPQEFEAKLPMRRRGTDQEIANAVLFLASDLADYITGVYLPVAGGNVMPSI